MRGMFTFVVAATAATLMVSGCSSDSDATGGSGGASTAGGGSAGDSAAGEDGGGAAGAAPAVQCVGDYAALSQGQFDSRLSSSGKCTGESDSALVCSQGVTVIAEECGADCYKNDAPDDTTQDACTKACILEGTTPSLSTGCVGCYVTDVGCARDHCLIKCGPAPTSDACLNCRISNGCVTDFFACSGLPGGAPVIDGSAGAAGTGGT